MPSSSTLIAALALVFVAGCTQQPERVDSAPPAPTGKQAIPARPVYDPPAKFDTEAGVLMPWESTSGLLTFARGTWLGDGRIPVALHKDKAYIATLDRLLAFNTTTGSLTATITPTAEALRVLDKGNRNNAAPPVITPGANPLVLTPFFVRQPGAGTQAPRELIELTATDASSDKVAWRLPLALPSWTKEGRAHFVSVVGATETVAVVTVSTGDSPLFSAATTYGIDLATRRVLWTKDLFKATAMTENIVAGELETGSTYEAAAGYDLLTGAERWRGDDRYSLDVKTAGPHLLLVQARHKNDYLLKVRQFLDAETGTVKREVPEDFAGSRCDHDGKTTIVCSWDLGNLYKVRAFNDRTASPMWQLPDQTANRIAPRVTAVWNGRVYGKTDDGPLALDAQTGADLPTQPGVAPFLVNGYTGLALSPAPEDDLTAYPATG
ncbi:hypothetical protein [Streptomyces sp. NPDC048603]|uniref:hypothetical protein n=1 Tax=Streptomyces sp. NPDC048603 TaxID=3365577 RepID=UPI0037120136